MKTSKEEKVRLFRRILVSYNDFKQAAHISSHILTAKLHRDYQAENRHILQALNCAMIIAYARPFSGNKSSKTMMGALPENFLAGFEPDERALHQVVMKDRNKLLAHSDHDAWQLRLCVMRPSGRKPTLVLLHRDTTAPLDEKHTRMFDGMAHKLMESVFAERLALEKELVALFPTCRQDGRVTGNEQAMRFGGWS